MGAVVPAEGGPLFAFEADLFPDFDIGTSGLGAGRRTGAVTPISPTGDAGRGSGLPEAQKARVSTNPMDTLSATEVQ